MSSVYEDLKESCEYAAEFYEDMANGMLYCPNCCILVPEDHCGGCGETPQGLSEYLADNVYDARVTTDIHGTEMYSCRLMIAGGGPNIYIDTGVGAICGYWGSDEVAVPLSSRCCDAINQAIDLWRDY